MLPIGSIANVYGNGLSLGLQNNPASSGLGLFWGTDPDPDALQVCTQAYGVSTNTSLITTTTPTLKKSLGVVQKTTDGGESGLYADLTDATASTINEIREAFQLQRMFERDARGGSRYTEIIRSHFGVVSPDARMQRPEYLGGNSYHLNIVPVSNTSSTTQANQAAFGIISFQEFE